MKKSIFVLAAVFLGTTLFVVADPGLTPETRSFRMGLYARAVLNLGDRLSMSKPQRAMFVSRGFWAMVSTNLTSLSREEFIKMYLDWKRKEANVAGRTLSYSVAEAEALKEWSQLHVTQAASSAVDTAKKKAKEYEDKARDFICPAGGDAPENDDEETTVKGRVVKG